MSTMLLSIKPRYAKVILEGKKCFEFRKNKPRNSVTRIVIYASSPQQQVVGEALIDEILEGTPEEIWSIARTGAGITKKFFSSYYAGRQKAIAYKLSQIKIYETPMHLSDFGIVHPPQSFTYLD